MYAPFSRSNYDARALLIRALILLSLCLYTIAADADLYKILGVDKTATTKEIKQAYRRKALDTHPDKNKNVPPDEAAEKFRQVVHAFEILSDTSTRATYDRTGSTTPQGQQFNRGQQFSQGVRFTWNFQRRVVRLKDRFDVQEAQSRVLHVVSLDQLQTVLLDDDDRLERNLLICFVTPGDVEQNANDELVFPYPFAGMSSQGIWWEDLMQTVQVRYNRKNDLTEFFNIPHGDELRKSGKPIILFGKRGEKLSPDMRRVQTNQRNEFEVWAWECIEVSVDFINNHDYPAEIYWLHGSRAHFKTILQPGERWAHTTMLSHEWYIRDARVDKFKDTPNRNKLSTSSSLGTWKIVSDESPQEIVIKRKTCFDLSGHCHFWNMQNECRKNPNFMNDKCRLTCNQCSEDDDKDDETDPAIDQSGDEL